MAKKKTVKKDDRGVPMVKVKPRPLVEDETEKPEIKPVDDATPMISITVRPRACNFKIEWREMFVAYFEKKKKRYVVAVEKGNHLQIAYECGSRANNVTPAIKKLLNFAPEDDDERRAWLKVKKNRNPRYHIGYCCKEGNWGNISTNYTDDVLNDCIEFYSIEKNKAKHLYKRDWACSSMNTLVPHAYEFCIAQGKDPKNWSIQAVSRVMFGEGLIPLSLGMKLRNDAQSYWEQYCLVKAGEDPLDRWQAARDKWDS